MKEKKLIRQLLSLALTLALAVSLLAVPALADTEGDWEYTVTNGEAMITAYTGSAATVTIPSVLGGCPVTEIKEHAFKYNECFVDVTIPDSVRNIRSYAFSCCYGLKSVTIGNGVKYIQQDAFKYCPNLTSLTISNKVRYIGSNAFARCTGLQRVDISDLAAWCGIDVREYGSPLCNDECRLYLNGAEVEGQLTIPDGVTSIAPYAFKGCAGLTSVTFPDNLQVIGESAFSGCTSLTTLTLPRTVVNIGTNAFSGCTGLTRVIFPGLVVIGSGAFSGCTGLAVLAIPERVSMIPQNAFWGCTGLTNIILPRGLKTVDWNAFSGCSSLAYIHYPGTAADWANVTLYSGNEALSGAALCVALSIRYISKTVRVGESYQFTATNAMGDCSWFVGNESIAEVSAEGTVTGLAAGNTYLYCQDSVGAQTKCLLKIAQALLSIRYSSKIVTVGEPFAFTATGGSGGYSWSVLDPEIAAVDGDGNVTGLAAGSTTLCCSDSSGTEVRCLLTVVEPVSIRYSVKTVKPGKSFRFTAAGGSGTYAWRVGNTSVAVVDGDGNVTGMSPGNTWLYCRDSYGTEVRCLLRITALSITYSEKTISLGAAFQFNAEGGTGGYTWRVGNTSVAAVDSSGKVTGKTTGNTYLYCTDSAGNEVKCLLKIK